MIAHIIGEANFKAAVNNFQEERNRGKTQSFISYMIQISKDKEKLLEEIIENWKSYKGHPVVTIERNYQANSAIIKQSAFIRYLNTTSLRRNWQPLNFATQDDADFDDTTVTNWLDPEMESLEIVTPPPDKWLICNKQQFGYYRVNYDDRNWELIAKYLKSGNYQKIHVLNRAQLIDDAFVLAEFGYLNFSIAFDLARYLKVETKYVPWATFWEKMFRLYQYSSISGSQYYEPFKNMILELSGPLERKYLSDAAVDDDDRMERLNKIAFIKWTCFYDSTLCRNYSLAKLKNWLADPVKNPLVEDIRKEILCAGIRSADKETCEKLLEKYLINKDETILYALKCSSKYEILHELITLFVSGQLIQQNSWYFLIKIAEQSTIGLDTIINFIGNKQNVIHSMHNQKDFDSSTGFINNLGKITYDMNHFQDLVDSFCTVIEQFITNNQQLDKFKKILYDNTNILGSREVAQYLYFTEIKVDASNSVFNSMKTYWNVKEK
ncbi:aminopeptidase N-like [Cotesia typhae]|uniref:aminopeptidase N-like n=1 Tax=Cotesia typhae TaxID=2053667 RepID=UPI003D689F72